jgi:hypothetical protein
MDVLIKTNSRPTRRAAAQDLAGFHLSDWRAVMIESMMIWLGYPEGKNLRGLYQR